MVYISDLLMDPPTEPTDEELAEDQEIIAAHVATCTVDGFCYICQCL